MALDNMEQDNANAGGATAPANDFRTNEQLRAEIDAGIRDAQAYKAAQLEDPYGQMREIVERKELDGLRNTQRADAAVAAAMKVAQERKGVLPPEAVGFLNRQFGFDGKNTGIVEGGFDRDGNFGFVFAERGKDGSTSHRMQMIPLAQQLGVMEGNLQLFGQDAVDGLKDRLLKGGMSSAELDAMSAAARGRRERMAQRIEELRPKNTQLEVAKLNADVAARKNAYDLQKSAYDLQKADMTERGKFNRALMANLAQLLRNKQVYEGLYRGDPLYDEDGKPLMEYDKNGNEVQRYGRANDDVVSQRLMDMASRLAAASGGGGAGGGGNWASAGLPSARDLVGGGAGGRTAQGGTAAQGAQQPAAQATQGGQPAAAQAQGGAQQGAGQQQGAEATTTQGWRPKTSDEIARVKAEIAARKSKAQGESGEKTTEQLEREAAEAEESMFNQIRQAGGRMFKGENGHRYIDVGGGFGKLPEDSEVRAQLDENGHYDLDADGHSIEDAIKVQGEVQKAVQNWAQNRNDFAKKEQAARDAFRREALKAHPGDGTRRKKYVKDKMEAWLKENDPDYEKKRKRAEHERALDLDNVQPSAMSFMM